MADLKAHPVLVETKLKVTPSEERMLVLEKAVKKSFEKSVRRVAPSTVSGSGGRLTYASIVTPPAMNAAVRIQVVTV